MTRGKRLSPVKISIFERIEHEFGGLISIETYHMIKKEMGKKFPFLSASKMRGDLRKYQISKIDDIDSKRDEYLRNKIEQFGLNVKHIDFAMLYEEQNPKMWACAYTVRIAYKDKISRIKQEIKRGDYHSSSLAGYKVNTRLFRTCAKCGKKAKTTRFRKEDLCRDCLNPPLKKEDLEDFMRKSSNLSYAQEG